MNWHTLIYILVNTGDEPNRGEVRSSHISCQRRADSHTGLTNQNIYSPPTMPQVHPPNDSTAGNGPVGSQEHAASPGSPMWVKGFKNLSLFFFCCFLGHISREMNQLRFRPHPYGTLALHYAVAQAPCPAPVSSILLTHTRGYSSGGSGHGLPATWTAFPAQSQLLRAFGEWRCGWEHMLSLFLPLR